MIVHGILASFVSLAIGHRMILVVCGRLRVLPFSLCDMLQYTLESRTVRLVRLSSKTGSILRITYGTAYGIEIRYVNPQSKMLIGIVGMLRLDRTARSP
jgi:hypothetical protein